MARKAKRDDGLIEVELIAPHTHAGEQRYVGERLRLRPDQVERLERQSIARRVDQEASVESAGGEEAGDESAGEKHQATTTEGDD